MVYIWTKTEPEPDQNCKHWLWQIVLSYKCKGKNTAAQSVENFLYGIKWVFVYQILSTKCIPTLAGTEWHNSAFSWWPI